MTFKKVPWDKFSKNKDFKYFKKSKLKSIGGKYMGKKFTTSKWDQSITQTYLREKLINSTTKTYTFMWKVKY